MALDKKKTIAMLAEIAEMAEHATLTGINGSMTPRAIMRYNALLTSLIDEELVPKELFSPLSAEATLGDLLVDSKLLVSYLRDTREHRVEVECECECEEEDGDDGRCCTDKHLILRLAPFASSEDLHMLVDSYLSQGQPVDGHFVEMIAPFIQQEHLGALIRKIADQGRPKERKVTVQVRNIEGAPKPPNPPSPPSEMAELTELAQPLSGALTMDITTTIHHEDDQHTPDALVHNDVPVEIRMQALMDRMKSPDVSDEEVEELAQEILRLKRTQKQ